MSDWTPSSVLEWGADEPAIGERPGWHTEAVCRDTDPEIFFPTDGMGVLIAQRICNRCPVREECLEYALTNNEDHGVWGGESERGRRKIRRRRRMDRRAG